MADDVMVFGQDSWTLESDKVKVNMTKKGGHMAPAIFHIDTDHPVEPYFMAPWGKDNDESLDPILRILRGNFFCLPFGGESVAGGQRYLTHGETANLSWSLENERCRGPVSELHLAMNTHAPEGRITKKIALLEGHNAVYTKHELNGYSGRFPLGYHATLDLPDEEGALRLFKGGDYTSYTPPEIDLFNGDEYSSLKPDQTIKDLSQVKTIWSDPSHTDCSTFPRRKGYMDFIQIQDEQNEQPGWTIALIPSKGYLWFSLKNPKILPTTMLWISNGGRKASPWNGRNRCLGLEDVCGYFAFGVDSSQKNNSHNQNGLTTAVDLSGLDKNSLNYIEGVALISKDFHHVENLDFASDRIIVRGSEDKKVEIPVKWDFLTSGQLI